MNQSMYPETQKKYPAMRKWEDSKMLQLSPELMQRWKSSSADICSAEDCQKWNFPLIFGTLQLTSNYISVHISCIYYKSNLKQLYNSWSPVQQGYACLELACHPKDVCLTRYVHSHSAGKCVHFLHISVLIVFVFSKSEQSMLSEQTYDLWPKLL